MCDSERKLPSIHKLTHWLRLESLGALLQYIIPQPSVDSGMGETLVTKVSPVRLLYTLELKYPIVMGERKMKAVKLAFSGFIHLCHLSIFICIYLLIHIPSRFTCTRYHYIQDSSF